MHVNHPWQRNHRCRESESPVGRAADSATHVVTGLTDRPTKRRDYDRIRWPVTL